MRVHYKVATRMAVQVALGVIKEFDPDADRITPTSNWWRYSSLLTVLGRTQKFWHCSVSSEERPMLCCTTCWHLLFLRRSLKRHYQPNVVVIAERFQFHRRTQGPEESVAEFLTELRRLAMHCDFKNHLTEALRDRLVCGLHNSGIQKK